MADFPTFTGQLFPVIPGGSTLELTSFTPTGTFTWGTIYETTEKTLTVTAVAGALPAAALLEFSGDTTDFECTEIEGNDLATPIAVGSLSLNNRYFSWEESAATTLKFQPVYTDGTEKTVTLSVKDIQGNEINSFAMTASLSDPVREAVTDFGGAFSHWTMQDTTPGLKVTDDQVADNLLTATANYQLYTKSSTKTVVDGVLAGLGSSRSISRYLNSTATGTSHCIGIKVAQVDTVVAAWNIVNCDFSDGAMYGWAVGGGTYTASTLPTYKNPWVDTGAIGTRYGASSAISGVKTIFCSARFDGSRTYYVFSDVTGTWGDTYTADYAGNQIPNGYAAFIENTKTGVDLNFIPGSLHSSDGGAVKMEAIYNACKV